MGYKDDLKTAHWQKRRLEVLEKANWLCEDCGAGGDTQLQVHHTVYIQGRRAWEYGDEFLMSVCDTCHKQRQGFENGLRTALGKITRCMSKGSLEIHFWDTAEIAAESDHNRQIRMMQAIHSAVEKSKREKRGKK